LAFINDKIDNIPCGARRKRFAPQFILQRKSPLCLTKFEVGKKDSSFLQKSVDKRRSVWYYSQARWGNGQERPEEQRGTHLENYIVQD
jgi:hypothetical protein